MGVTMKTCRSKLQIDEACYLDIRARFVSICKETGIRCSHRFEQERVEPERWQEAKDKLVSQTPALQSAFSETSKSTSQRPWDHEANNREKKIALEYVCRNVVNRPRERSKWSLPQFFETLGISQTQGAEMRSKFYRILNRMANDSPSFNGNRSNIGVEVWKALLKEWLELSPVLQTSFDNPDGINDDEERAYLFEGLAGNFLRNWKQNRKEREDRANGVYLPKNGSVRSETPPTVSSTPIEESIRPQTLGWTSEDRISELDDRVGDLFGVARDESKTRTPPPHHKQELPNPDQLPTPISLPTGNLDDSSEIIDATAIKIPLCDANAFTMQIRVHESSTATVEGPVQMYNVPVCPANVLELLGHVFKTWPDFKRPISSIDGMVEGNFLKMFSIHPREKARDPNEEENGRLVQYLKSVSERGVLPVFVVTLERPTVKP